jgi:hypothetical protein
VASLILFICLIAFMFQAGYQWRKYEETQAGTPSPDSADTSSSSMRLDSMVGKL